MKGFVVVGTDTDAGKTAFSLLFLTAFADQFAYWKPVETGESDTEKVRRLVPTANGLQSARPVH
jgi:adenosylmethionine-8-amino-7-oxononanoate aminotransferase